MPHPCLCHSTHTSAINASDIITHAVLKIVLFFIVVKVFVVCLALLTIGGDLVSSYLLPIRLSSGLVGCKVAIPPFVSLPETTVPRVLLLRVQRLSFLPLRWAASLLGLRSVPRPIILSCHWTSLLLGSFKVLSQAHDHLDLFPFLNLVQRYCFFLTCANFFHYFFKKKLIFRKMGNLFIQIDNKTPRAITARGAQFHHKSNSNMKTVCKGTTFI